MKVQILQLDTSDEDAGQKLAGTFHWDGHVPITADPPNSRLLRNILTEDDSVHDHRTGEPIDPKTHPREWMEELRFVYTSAYLRATKPE